MFSAVWIPQHMVTMSNDCVYVYLRVHVHVYTCDKKKEVALLTPYPDIGRCRDLDHVHQAR